MTDDTPDEPEDEVTDEVVTDDTPDEPEDEVVTDDTPDEPEGEVTDEEVVAATDLWEMFNDMFEGFSGADSFVFASFGTVTNIEGQGALIHTENFVFIPEEFGSFQQVVGQEDTDMAQIDGAQIPDTLNLESDLGICGGFESFIG